MSEGTKSSWLKPPENTRTELRVPGALNAAAQQAADLVTLGNKSQFIGMSLRLRRIIGQEQIRQQEAGKGKLVQVGDVDITPALLRHYDSDNKERVILMLPHKEFELFDSSANAAGQSRNAYAHRAISLGVTVFNSSREQGIRRPADTALPLRIGGDEFRVLL